MKKNDDISVTCHTHEMSALEAEFTRLQEENMQKPILLHEIRTRYEEAKKTYVYEDRETWQPYIFWRHKYELVHDEQTSKS